MIELEIIKYHVCYDGESWDRQCRKCKRTQKEILNVMIGGFFFFDSLNKLHERGQVSQHSASYHSGQIKHAATAVAEQLRFSATGSEMFVISLSAFLSIHLLICLYISLSIFLFIRQFICLSISLPTFVSIHLLICLSISLSIFLSIRLLICLSISLSITPPPRDRRSLKSLSHPSLGRGSEDLIIFSKVS